jgi:hypothetical protein
MILLKIAVPVIIALILLKGAYREQKSTQNFAWNSRETTVSSAFAYALAIAALIFIAIAALIAARIA